MLGQAGEQRAQITFRCQLARVQFQNFIHLMLDEPHVSAAAADVTISSAATPASEKTARFTYLPPLIPACASDREHRAIDRHAWVDKVRLEDNPRSAGGPWRSA